MKHYLLCKFFSNCEYAFNVVPFLGAEQGQRSGDWDDCN